MAKLLDTDASNIEVTKKFIQEIGYNVVGSTTSEELAKWEEILSSTLTEHRNLSQQATSRRLLSSRSRLLASSNCPSGSTCVRTQIEADSLAGLAKLENAMNTPIFKQTFATHLQAQGAFSVDPTALSVVNSVAEEQWQVQVFTDNPDAVKSVVVDDGFSSSLLTTMTSAEITQQVQQSLPNYRAIDPSLLTVSVKTDAIGLLNGASWAPTQAPTRAPTSSPTATGNDDLSDGEIAGIAVGVAVFLGIAVAVSSFACKTKPDSSSVDEYAPNHGDTTKLDEVEDKLEGVVAGNEDDQVVAAQETYGYQV